MNTLDAYAVEFLGPEKVVLHSNAEFGRSRRGACMAAAKSDTRQLAFFLDGTKSETVLSLCSLDSQIGHQGAQCRYGLHVRLAPVEKRSPTLRVRVCDSDISAKGLSEEFQGFSSYLSNVNPLGIGRLPRVLSDSDGVGIALDADCPVRIEDAGEIGECCLVHPLSLRGGGDVIWAENRL